MRFVHTADNHLDMPLSSLAPHKAQKRRAMRLLSFSKIIDYTLQNADMLLISGDLFDSPTPPASVLAFCTNEFKRLGDIPVFIALGNHDYGLAHNFPGNVHVFPPYIEKIKYRGAVITGASFSSPSAYFENAVPPCDEGGFNILCIHGDIFTKSTYNPLNKELLSHCGYDYVALGHVHDYFKHKNIVYPGCHDGAGFDECGEKSFIYGEFDNHFLTISSIPSSSLVYSEKNFDISNFSSSLDIANAISDAFPDGIYRFSLTGTPQEGFIPNVELINSYLDENFFSATAEDKTSITGFSQNSLIEKLLNDYITNEEDEEIALLAMRYALSALKGDMTI